MRDGKLPKRQYTDEFKIEAIRLSDSVGGHETEAWDSLSDVEQLVAQAQASGRGGRRWRRPQRSRFVGR